MVASLASPSPSSQTHDPLSSRGAALTDVSVAFRPGRVHILCGSNGSGKTTLSLLLAGLQQPTTGAVRLDGVDLRSLDKDVLYENLVSLCLFLCAASFSLFFSLFPV